MAICQNCGNTLVTKTVTGNYYTFDASGNPLTRTETSVDCVICAKPATVAVT